MIHNFSFAEKKKTTDVCLIVAYIIEAISCTATLRRNTRRSLHYKLNTKITSNLSVVYSKYVEIYLSVVISCTKNAVGFALFAYATLAVLVAFSIFIYQCFFIFKLASTLWFWPRICDLLLLRWNVGMCLFI